MDLNVEAAWALGYTGKGVTTAIMDDGKPFIIDSHSPHSKADFRAVEVIKSEMILNSAARTLVEIVNVTVCFFLFLGVDYMHPDLYENFVSTFIVFVKHY